MEDAETALGMKVVATLPTLRNDTLQSHAREIVIHRDSAYAQEIFLLRHWLLGEWRGLPGKIVAVTSVTPGVGKTVIATNLAQQAVLVEIKTLLIDCDLNRQDPA